MENNHGGYLRIIVGPMYSGKTSKLLEIAKHCEVTNTPYIAINYSLDKRYHDSMLSSHDKVMIPSTNVEFLSYIDKEDIEKARYILINEAQFFPDLYDFVHLYLKKGKTIYVSGLDGDFERKKIGQVLDLIPLCDKVQKLHARCDICKDGKEAPFSLRLTNETSQILIGSDNYKPVCRACYDASCKT